MNRHISWLKSHTLRYPVLPRDEQLELIKTVQTTHCDRMRKKAADKLINHTMGMIAEVANRMSAAYNIKTLTVEDLVMSGVLGARHAIDKFDLTKGYAFTTYAWNWVRQYMQVEICKCDRAIRIPRDVEDMLHQASKGKPVKNDRNLKSALQCIFPYSLDAPVPGTDDLYLHDSLPAEIPEWDRAELEDLSGIVQSLLDSLKPTDRRVIEFMYLSGDDVTTLDAAGKRFGYTRERARQIRKKSFGVMSKHKHLVQGIFSDV